VKRRKYDVVELDLVKGSKGKHRKGSKGKHRNHIMVLILLCVFVFLTDKKNFSILSKVP